jgi:signal peptidase I
MDLLHQLTEGLANLSIKWVLIAVGIMALAVALFQVLSPRRRDPTFGWLIENTQVVLSVVVVVFLFIRPFLFQAFYIPSSSMEPTLKGPESGHDDWDIQRGAAPPQGTGDRLLVDKLIYRFFNPSRGDIVVFKAPPQASAEEKEFIKRVIGLPGETIEVVPPRFLVDGRPILRMVVETTPGDTGKAVQIGKDQLPPKIRQERARIQAGYQDKSLDIIVAPQPTIQATPHYVVVDGKVEYRTTEDRIQQVEGTVSYGGDAAVPATVFTEDGDPRLIVVRGRKLSYEAGHVEINGRKLDEDYIADPPRYAMSPRKLAADEYFMMGDNRNNSNDSHMWGPLKRNRVIGRAEILFWPLNRVRVLHVWLICVLVGAAVGYQLLLRAFAPREVSHERG